MSKLFIAHHVQNCFDESLQERSCMTSETLAGLIIGHCLENNYDKVILHIADIDSTDYPIIFDQLPNLQIEYYSWGWDIEEDGCTKTEENGQIVWVDEYNNKFIEGGLHGEYVELPEWSATFTQYEEVHYAGCFEGECLDDLEQIFSFLNIDANKFSIACV